MSPGDIVGHYLAGRYVTHQAIVGEGVVNGVDRTCRWSRMAWWRWSGRHWGIEPLECLLILIEKGL